MSWTFLRLNILQISKMCWWTTIPPKLAKDWLNLFHIYKTKYNKVVRESYNCNYKLTMAD